MRQLIICLILLGISNLGYCKKERTIITGTIGVTSQKNITGTVIDFSNFYIYDWLNLHYDTSQIDNKGQFKFEINIDHPVYFLPNHINGITWRVFGQNFLTPHSIATSGDYVLDGILIEPGDSIYVDASDANNQSNLTDLIFSGKGAEKLQCMQEIMRRSNNFESPLLKENSMRFTLADSVTSMVIETIGKYRNKISHTSFSILQALFVTALSYDISELIVGNTNGINNFKRTLYVQDSRSKEIFKDRASIRDKLVNLNSEELIYSLSFLQELIKIRAYSRFAMEHKLVSVSNMSYIDKFNALNSYMYRGKIKYRVMCYFILGYMASNNNLSDLAPKIKQFLKESSGDNYFIQRVKTEFEQRVLTLVKGKPAYKFRLPDTTGKIIRMEDFNGKAVLIDFMYTGCSGCMGMAPTLETMEESYKNNDKVAFVAVSISPDTILIPGTGMSDWKRGIGIFSPASSIQLCAGGTSATEKKGAGHTSPVVEFYQIKGYPVLVLIDKRGNIIASRIADPRLDNGANLKKIINNAINQN